MYIIDRVFKSIKKNKLKYLFLTLLIVTLNTLLFTSLKIFEKNQIEINEINSKYGTNVTIKSKTFHTDLNYEDYIEFSQLNYIEKTNFEQKLNLPKDKLSIITPNINLDSNRSTTLPLIGNNDITTTNDFQLENYQIQEGEFPNSTFEILIHEDLANNNNLTLDDTISLKYQNKQYKFKVVGIYKSANKEAESFTEIPTIYTTYDTTQILDNSTSNVTAVYTLKDYSDFKPFEEELHALGLSTDYFVDNNKQTILAKTTPILEQNNKLINFKNIITIIFLIIISIISSFILNAKKNNLKILRMLGMSRINLTIISIFEISIIMVASLAIAFVFSTFLSNTYLKEALSAYYFYNIPTLLVTNLAVLFLITFETILFIYGYQVDEIVTKDIENKRISIYKQKKRKNSLEEIKEKNENNSI